ncbi:hypothetical protein [Asticcacaulis sp. YBE204]|uniref:hypothetical protein n=1 Tax=Asticcacaulis sp. YBE204 TaxID=1282363 RepID=UPI0003C3ADB4|nr:hypothetical protein [Asticcacaulis sp. YBE204]ESQ77794.1 hypothetical protein AEYBE204_16830 [Asticcacaulis sp. YBE204]
MHSESSDIPRVYRYGPRTFWLMAVLGVLCVGAAVAGAVWTLGQTAWNDILLGVMGTAIGLICGFSSLLSLRSHLDFYADRFEFQDLLRRVVVMKRDIVGARNIQNQYGALHFTVVYNAPKSKTVTISNFGRKDEDFLLWFEDFDNLDAKEEREAADRILANPVYGDTEEARHKAVTTQETWIGRGGMIGLACGLWGMIYPSPYLWALACLAALPALTVGAVVLNRKRWMLHKDEDDNRLSLHDWAAMPAGILGLRAMLDIEMIDWEVPLAIAAGLSLVAYGLMRWVEQRRWQWSIIIYGVVYLGYFWGLLVFGNWYLDRSEAQTFPVTVLEKNAGKHRDGLEVTAWGDRAAGEEVSVDDHFYRSVEPGQQVCVYRYSGAAGWRWIIVGTCPASSSGKQ